jgi:hypothetical protein
MAERPNLQVIELLATIAQAIGAVSISSRLAAQNSKDAKEAAQRAASKGRKGPFDVLSGRIAGDTNAQSITRLLRGESESRYQQPQQPIAEPHELGLRPEPEEERSGFFARAFRRRRQRHAPTYWREKAVSTPEPEPELETVEMAREREEKTERRKAVYAVREKHQATLKDRLSRIAKKPRPRTVSSAASERQEKLLQFAKDDAIRKKQVEQLSAGKNPFQKPTFFQDFSRGWGMKQAAQRAGIGRAIKGITGLGRGAATGGAGGGGAVATGAGAAGEAAGGAEALTGAAGAGAAAATALPIIGIIVGMSAAVAATTKALHEMALETIESGREMAKYSGQIQGAIALYDRQNRIMEMQTAREQAGSFRALTEQTLETQSVLRQFLSDVGIIKNILLTGFEKEFSVIIEAIKLAHPEIQGIHALLQWWTNRNRQGQEPALQRAERLITTQKSVMSNQKRDSIRVPRPPDGGRRLPRH